MSNRENMIAEATDLGLEFPGNISNIKLAAMIADFKGEPAPVEEKAPPGPAVKAEETPSEEDTVDPTNPLVRQRAARVELFAKRRRQVSEAKKRAMKKQIVTITNKDSRDNDVMTTCYLSFENQHFSLSKVVPLDIPVELETALVKIAEGCMMTLHKDEIIGGKRTGNKVAVRTKKYAVSYSRQEPK
jgi:heme-binding NEAT domain protein